MGGKIWSEKEEQTFWEAIVPRSPHAPNPEDRALSWAECVDLMKEAMGKDARRQYTQTMLYEHHYQNTKSGHRSPRALRFVEHHLQQAAYYEGLNASGSSDSLTASAIGSSGVTTAGSLSHSPQILEKASITVRPPTPYYPESSNSRVSGGSDVPARSGSDYELEDPEVPACVRPLGARSGTRHDVRPRERALDSRPSPLTNSFTPANIGSEVRKSSKTIIRLRRREPTSRGAEDTSPRGYFDPDPPPRDNPHEPFHGLEAWAASQSSTTMASHSLLQMREDDRRAAHRRRLSAPTFSSRDRFCLANAPLEEQKAVRDQDSKMTDASENSQRVQRTPLPTGPMKKKRRISQVGDAADGEAKRQAVQISPHNELIPQPSSFTEQHDEASQ